MKVKIYRINKDNPLPTQANKNDAGWDCYASQDVEIDYGCVGMVPLGIIAQAPEGHHFKLVLRSSAAFKRAFMLANGVGIIDSSYCGETDEIKALIRVPDMRDGDFIDEPYIIKKGERIAQLILEKNTEIQWDEQEDQNFAGKNRGGFGSTGT